jgi:HK97 family phage major capsid protein
MDFKQAHREAFYRYLLQGARRISSDDAKLLAEKRGVTESGTSIAPDSWADIIGDGFDTNYLLSKCTVVKVTGNKLNVTGYSESDETQNRITYNEETTRVDLASAAFSLPRFTISGESPAGYSYNYESIAIPLKEVGVNVVVSKELIEESASSLSVEKMLVDLLTKKLYSEIERQVINGRPLNSTAANRRECQGLYNYAIQSTQIVTDTGSSGANHIQFSTLARAMEKLRASGFASSCWIFGSGSMSNFLHQSENSAAAHPPADADMAAFARFLGKPAYFTPHFTYASSGDILALLVDLKQYVIAMHNEGVQVERLNEVAAATGQVVLRATVRVGGNLIDPKSYVQIVSN